MTVRLVQQPPEPLLSRHEMAGELGVSVKTLDRMVKEGLPSVTYGRRLRRFESGRVRAWLALRERKAA